MGKSWDEVVESPQFQALDPAKQAAAKQQYFDQVVAPRVPAAKRDVALAQFKAYQPKAPSGALSGALSEAGGVVGNMGATLGEGIADMFDAAFVSGQRAVHNATESEDAAALRVATSETARQKQASLEQRAGGTGLVRGASIDTRPTPVSLTDSTPLGEWINRAHEVYGGMKTAGTKRSIREIAEAGKEDGSQIVAAWDTLKAVARNPVAAGEMMAENAGLMLPTMLSQRLVAMPVYRKVFEETFKDETKRFAADGIPKAIAEKVATDKAVTVARNAAIRAGAANGLWTEASMGAGFAGEQASQTILTMDEKEIGKSPAYSALIEQGMSDDDARMRLAQEAKTLAGPIAGASDALVSRLTGGVKREAEIVTGMGRVSRGAVNAALRFGSTVGKETLEEVGQEVGEQVGQNIGETVATGRPLTAAAATKGTGQAGALGGIMGAGMGAGFAGAEAIINAFDAKAPDEAVPPGPAANAPPATPPPAAGPTPAPAPGQPAAPPGASGAAAGPSPDQDINAQFEAFDAAPQQEANSPQDQQVEAAAIAVRKLRDRGFLTTQDEQRQFVAAFGQGTNGLTGADLGRAAVKVMMDHVAARQRQGDTDVQQAEAAAGRIGDGGAVAAPQEGQAPPEAAAVPGEEAGAGTAGPGQGRDVEAPLNAPLGVIVKNEDGTMSVVPDPDSDRKMAELRAHNAKVRAEFNAEQEAAKAPAGNGVGSDAGNGWLHGPEGSRVNVGSAIGTGGVLMDKQYRAGTRGTFYIGKDGNLVDADNIIANKPETYGLLWRPDDADQRRAGEDALREFALASTKEEKKAARDKIKAVVNQEQTDAGDGQPGAGEQVAAAPAEVARQAAKEGEFPVQRVDVGSIEVSPSEYQFRSKVNAAGVDDRMAGVKQWDDLRADPLILHRRKDGRLFVADGHHRLELAKRLGVKDVNAVILDEADGYTVEDARKQAALKNLASGNGTPLDAAKVFRAEPGDVDAAIERHNLPNNSAVRQGAGLAKLSDETFGAVVNGLVTERDGAVIGDSFKSPEEQAAALKVFQKIAPQNREQAQILAQQIKQAGFGKKDDEQTDMFGAAMQDSLLAERVKLIDAVGRSLKNDKAVFAGLERNASRIESAGNRLERDANKRIADESAQLAGLIGQLSATDQDISRALNEGARKLKDNPGSMQTVLAETREAVRHAAARITGQRGNASQDDGDAGKPPAAAASRGGAQAGERVQPAAPAAAVPVAQPAEAPGLELAAQKDRASEIVDSSYGAIGMAVDTPSSIADERTLRNIKKLVKAHPEAQPLLDVLTGAKRLTKAADAAHPSDARAAEEFFKRGLAALPTELLEKVDKAITRIVRAEDDSDAMYATAKAMGMSDAQAKAAASWSTKTASKSKTKALTGERSEPKVAEPVPDYQTEPPPLTLEAQTEESRLADEKAVAAAEKAEKEAAAKAKADKDRAGFTLSGSASEADQAAAAGQLRLLEPTEYGYDHERGAAEVRSPRQGPQSGRPNSPANAGRGDSSPVPGQLDLFAAQGANHPPAAAVKKLRLLKRVKSVVTGFFRSGVERVTTAAEAAHIIAPLRKEAQESMLALVTDVDGKPLSVIRHSIGKTDSASVEIASVLGAVHAVPGAKHVWFAHNHPSGEHRQSSSDNLLTRHLTDLLKGTGVESRGMIVVAPGGKATVYEPDVGESTVKPTAARRTTEVPITQRRIVQVPGPTATIGEPRAMEAAIAAQPEAEGLLLLDTQLRPVGFLPMSAAEMAKLRTGDSATGAGAVMRAIESSGATRVAVKIETDNAAGMEAVRNIKGLAEGLLPKDSHGLPGMLDAVVAGNSIERTGRVAPANKPYAAMAGKGSNASGAVTTDAARSKVATFFGRPALRALDSKKLLGFAASVSDLPPHLRAWANARHGVHAFYDPDHAEHGTPAAWIIADRLESVDDVPGLVLHEIGVHFGLKQMLKADEFAKLLASLSKDASPAVAEAWAHVLKNYKHKEGSAEFREEVLARSTQQARFWEAPLWKRVLSRIRQFLFRLGFTKSLSDEDLGLLVARSLRRAIAKGSGPVAAQGQEVMAARSAQTDTPAFRKWFGGSKVVDAQGKALVVYHGTDATNYVPAATKAGSASARAELEKMAKAHGIEEWSSVPGVMERWLRMGMADQYGVTKQVAGHARELLRKAQSTTESEPRSDLAFDVFNLPGGTKELGAHFGTEQQASARGTPFAFYLSLLNPLRLPDLGTWDYQSVMRDARKAGVAISKAEYDAVFNAADNNAALRSLLQAKGYDGIVYANEAEGAGDSYIAFRREQIKSATGNNGEFDPNNPSIMAAMGSAPLESAKEKIGSPKEAAKLPLKERITQAAASAVDDIRHADVDRFEEGTFDRLLPIKNLAGMVPYMAARMSTGTGSVTYASMMFGAPQLKDRVIQHKEGTVGLMQVLQPVKGELQDFVDWLVGKRSEWLSSEEGGRRENNLSLEEISALVKLGEGREDRFEATAGALREFNTDLLRLARDTGLLSNDQVEAFTKDRYYVPFYRVDESAGGDLVDQESAIAPYTRRGLSHQSSGIKRLKGGTAKLHDPLENMLSNMSRLIDASLKNYALARTVTSAADHMTIAKEGDRANAVRVYWMGRPHWFNVSDESLLRSLKAVGHVAGKSFIMDVMRGSKRLLTAGVTAAPPFMVRNFMRDAMHAWIIDKNGFHFGIDSIRGARASMGTLFHAAKNPELADPSIVSLMFAGSSFLGGNIYGTDAKESATALRRAMVRSGMTQSAVDGYMKTLVSKSADFWHFYREMGDAVENANRVATFNAARAAGKSVAEAAFEAKDLLDYSLRGQYATLQVMADVLPFFNARMQGLYKIARELRRDPKLLGVISAQVAMRALPMMLASIALMAMYRDDDRYNDLEEWDKDANWHFWLGGAHIRIPKPFELGLLFGTLPERMFRAALRRDTPGETAAFFGRSVVSTLAVNPLPQLVRPGVESFFNFDMFKWRPIEGMGDQRKLPEQRYGSYTSPTMVEAGNATGLSPKQLEHIWNGYLGTMGTYALGMTDALIHAARKDVKPEPRIGDYPLIGSFVRTGPEWSNKWMTELYDLAEQANQTRQAINDLRGSESPRDNARAESLQKDNDKLLGERMRLNHATKRLGALRKLRDDVTADNTMTPKEKRERLDELQTEMNDVSRETVKETRQ